MSKGGVAGVVAWVTSGEVNPEPGGGERQKEAGHLVVKMRVFLGCCDAGDVIDGQVVHHQHHEGLRRPCKLFY